jgi:hypothetical protein
MGYKKCIVLMLTTVIFLSISGSRAASSNDKVGILITEWGTPARYIFEYSWDNNYWCRVGDLTEHEGQTCKIGHVGKFIEVDGKPYSMESHLGLMPWGLNHKYPGFEFTYDRSGIYKLENGIYKSIHPEGKSYTAEEIPDNVNVIPAREFIDTMSGALQFPLDPRDGSDPLSGWYKFDSKDMENNPFQNGLCDFYENNNITFIYYYMLMGMPVEPWLAKDVNDPMLFFSLGGDRFQLTKDLLDAAFGDVVDVRYGGHTGIPGHTKHEIEVAKEFAQEGVRKLVVSRETTDYNHYATTFLMANYVKEALCEENALDETAFARVNQIGRTPEFNTMNINMLKPYIEAYPEGSTIAMIYVTHGLSWPGRETYGFMGVQFPWWQEVIHENGFLNYLSWKKALQKEFGGTYNLVFSKNDSELLKDSLFSYGYFTPERLGGAFYTIRECMDMAREMGIKNMIIAPCHWYSDNQDTQVIMRKNNHLKFTPKEDQAMGKWDVQYCEDAEGNEVACTGSESANITITSSYTDQPDDFAMVYYVVLRGGVEKLGVYPKALNITIEASSMITKKDGGTVSVNKFLNPINKAKIEIPADPSPEYPDNFTPPEQGLATAAVPFSDPDKPYDCMWEDTEIRIGQQGNVPAMKSARIAGPAVYVGPYRTLFNKDVTITIPYRRFLASPAKVQPFIYNELTKDWDAIDGAQAHFLKGTVTFNTKVLGLFRAGVAQ